MPLAMERTELLLLLAQPARGQGLELADGLGPFVLQMAGDVTSHSPP